MKRFISMLALAATLSFGNAFAGVDDDVKAIFDRFVVAQNAHDLSAVRDLLLDSPDFLWVTRGAPIWGRDAALKRFESYQGTWKLSPDTPVEGQLARRQTSRRVSHSLGQKQP